MPKKRGKGSHTMFKKAGQPRLIIPRHPAPNTVRSILDALEEGNRSDV